MEKFDPENLLLDLVPSLGIEEGYPVGGEGIIAGAGSNGCWEFLAGPELTSPRFLSEERILLNGQPISTSMARRQGTGVFVGSFFYECGEGLLVDFAYQKKLIRAVFLRGDGVVRLKAKLTPFQSDYVSMPQKGIIAVKAGGWCFGNEETVNVRDRYLSIYFLDSSETEISINLHAGWQCVGLCHFVSYDKPEFPRLDPVEALKTALKDWENWFSKSCVLKKFSGKARDLMEAQLVLTRMQFSPKGGIVSVGGYKYANAYIRDMYFGIRLLLAAGHTEEPRSILSELNRRYLNCGYIPNYYSVDGDEFNGRSFHCDACEVPAYYLLAFCDFQEALQDHKFAEECKKSLFWSAKVQIERFQEQGFLEMNGDETEQYCCDAEGQEYGSPETYDYFVWKDPSFSSMTLAIASLRKFASLCRRCNWEEEIFYTAAEEILCSREKLFWREELQQHWWSRKRDGTFPPWQVLNALLLPLYLGEDNLRTRADLSAVLKFRRSDGTIPNVPGVCEGFCGNSLGLLLGAAVTAGDRILALEIMDEILRHPTYFGRYGGIWEFYSPSGKNNGHGWRTYEGGTLSAALLHAGRMIKD